LSVNFNYCVNGISTVLKQCVCLCVYSC
jgi:hypothetical protein